MIETIFRTPIFYRVQRCFDSKYVPELHTGKGLFDLNKCGNLLKVRISSISIKILVHCTHNAIILLLFVVYINSKIVHSAPKMLLRNDRNLLSTICSGYCNYLDLTLTLLLRADYVVTRQTQPLLQTLDLK